MRQLACILFLAVAPHVAWGQATSRIVKQQFSIGEQTEVIYELTLSTDQDQVRFEPRIGMLSCDPVTDKGSLRSGDKVNAEIIRFTDSIAYGQPLKWVGKYRITSWDTGYFEIPAPVIVLNDSTIHFQAVRFRVISPQLIEGQDIYETETEFIEIPEDSFYWLKRNWWWMALIIAAGTGVLLYRKYKKRIPPPPPEPATLSLKERTLMAIDALERSRMWEKGQLKEHYIEMSYILRSYLGVRYELNLLERTSYQTTVLLISQGLSQDTVKTIQLILDQSDLVKFAKSAPPEIEIYKISALARQIVAETSPITFLDV